MKTPYGQECRFYFSDYFRGRETQACRLIERNPNSPPWFVALCQTCPVPAILEANACPNLRLRGTVAKGFLGLTKRVQVEAYCSETGVEVKDPRVGCGQCEDKRSVG